MMVELGNKPLLRDFEQIQIPVHLNLGDQDNMVSQEETRKVHGVLNNSSFEIIDECPHPINQIPNEVLLGVIESSLT
jgi:pimeloyl-ACP methyl ester carboxylesterase